MSTSDRMTDDLDRALADIETTFRRRPWLLGVRVPEQRRPTEDDADTTHSEETR